jgi:DNA-binding SARP family transcriptional activator
MLAAKVTAPVESSQDLGCLTPLQDTLQPLTLFNAPAGYLLSGCLASSLRAAGHPLLWVRIGTEECGPASFLLALIEAAQRCKPGLGLATLRLMHTHLGPVQGWPPLYAALGLELGQNLPSASVIVIENFQHIYLHLQTFPLFKTHLLPALQGHTACLLVSDRPLKKTAFASQDVAQPATYCQVVGATDLRLRTGAALGLSRQYAPGLSADCIRHTLLISDGRAEVLEAVLAANQVLSPDLISQAVRKANSLAQLLSGLLRCYLAASSPRFVQILALAVQIEYLHPDLIHAVWGEPVWPAGPWLQPLEDQWVRLRDLWLEALRSSLRVNPTINENALQQVADYFFQTGAALDAIPLYFQLGDLVHAAQALDSVHENMLNMGQWGRLGKWLKRLPESIFKDWPWLAYSLGEIEAAQGNLDQARQSFGAASTWFVRRAEPGGACMSLLAESALAAWQEDYEKAQLSAQTAQKIAQDHQLEWHQGWSGWQLGCLSARREQIDEAASFFQQSAEALKDTPFQRLADETTNLSQRQANLQRQRDLHLQAAQENEIAAHQTALRLGRMILSPSENLESILAEQGWSKMPLMLKLSPAMLTEQLAFESPWTQMVKNALGQRLRHFPRLVEWLKPAQSASENDPPTPPTVQIALPALRLSGPLLDPIHANPEPEADAPAYALVMPGPGSTFHPGRPDHLDENGSPNAEQAANNLSEIFEAGDLSDPDNLHNAPVDPAPTSGLTIYCLGAFRVFHGTQFVENWGSKKAQQIFKYLVLHRTYPLPKEVLMNTIWPEADPEAARRNLHQAVYLLRQAIKSELGLSCILFDNDCYRIDPVLKLWVDHEEFERQVQTGQLLEKSGQVEQAMEAYGMAEGLYQDDFLVEDLYEDWPKTQREYLWQQYLMVTHRLAAYYLDQKDYTPAMALGRRILSKDNAQEPAHQILIRAYLGQGLRHMAMRQYKSCAQALKQELSIAPAPETQPLYRQILNPR